MKHHLRSNKTCLNCGAEVPERFCSHCGQENLEPKENLAHLINHFFSDITHYDSKFFLSIKYLFTRPGFLTKEYMEGKRARYLNPVRLYIFVSFVFFLTFFSIMSRSPYNKTLSIRQAEDTLRVGNYNIVGFGGSTYYKSIHQYDSLQKSLPASKKDLAITRASVRHYLQMRERYGERADEVFQESLYHNIPKIMFLFLPLFALFLKWLHNKQKYVYVDHAIFAIHFHAVIFILYLVCAIISLFMHVNYWIPNSILFIYLVVALRNAYQQTYLRSLIKTLVVSIVYVIIVYVGGQALALTTFFLT